MHKGMGRAQQIRGHKRHAKVLKRAKNKSSIVHDRNPGQIYWNALIDDEARKLKNEKISTETKVAASQVSNVKPQVHRRKSGSA